MASSGAEIAKLFISLGADVTDFEKGLGNAQSGLKRFGDKATDLGRRLSLGVTLPLLAFGAVAVATFDEQAKAVANVASAIKSTGGVAGRTLEQLKKQASDFQKSTLFGDETILQELTANLLTFTKVHGEVFDRAQKAIIDYSARTGRDLIGTTIMFGKALNDPILGLTALSRGGVQFTEQQKEIITALVEGGRVAEAQGLILDELEIQYGGAAEAAARAGAGPMKQLGMSIGEINERIGEVIAKAIMPFVGWLKTLADRAEGLSDGTIAIIVGLGAVAAAVPVVLVVLGQLALAFNAIRIAAITMGITVKGVLISTGVGAVIVALGLAAVFLIKHWEKVGPFFEELWNGIVLVTANAADQFLGSIEQMVSWIPGASAAIAVARANLSRVIDYASVRAGVLAFQKAQREMRTAAEEAAEAARLAAIEDLLDPESVGVVTEAGKKIKEIFEQLALDTTTLANKQRVLGHEFNASKEEVSLLETAMVSLLDAGINPNSEGFRKLAERLAIVRFEAKGAINDIDKLAELDKGKLGKMRLPTSLRPAPILADDIAPEPIGKPGLIAWFAKTEEEAKAWAAAIAAAINDGITDAASTFAEGVGKMAAGEASLGDVGAAILGTLADLAVRVGKIVVGLGVAMIKVKLAFTNPFTAIAAGLALIALGSFARASLSSALSGGGGGGASEGTSIGNFSPQIPSSSSSGLGMPSGTSAGSTRTGGSTQGGSMADGRIVGVQIIPNVLPSGAIEYSARTGERRAKRYGTEVI